MSMIKLQSADVVIIGGGVIGAACAEALVREGFHTVLLERSSLAAGASGAGQTAVGWGLFMDDYDLRLWLMACALYREWAASGVDVDYRQPNAMIVGEQDDEARLKAGVQELRARGVACEWLDQVALHKVEPGLSPAISGGALLEGIAQINPLRVVGELAQHASQFGAHIYTDTELIGVEMKRGKVAAVLTNRGRIATGTIVIAAGSWSSQVGRLLGLRVPVWPQKGHILVTEPMSAMVRHMVTEARYEATVKGTVEVKVDADGPEPGPPHVATVLQSQPQGQLLIGSSHEFAGFDREVDLGRITELAQRACRLVPGLRQVRIIRTYAGLRPWTPDGRPLIGPTKQASGVVFATGHAGAGITLALLTGQLIADLMTGRAASVDPKPLSPDRFVMC